MQFFLDDSNEHISCDGAPDLRLYRVLAGAEERLDAQMLLDPFEEQLDLPTLLVERTDGQRRKRQIVGQERECFAGVLVEIDHPAQNVGVTLARHRAGEAHLMIASEAGEGVDCFAPYYLVLQVVLGAGDEESAGGMQPMQSGEIDVGSICSVHKV